MKQIILILLSAGFAFFGFTVEMVYAEIAGLIAAIMTLSEAFNDWKDWHGIKAALSAVVVSAILTLIGWQFVAESFLYDLEFIKVVENFILVTLGALGLWPQYKKVVESI